MSGEIKRLINQIVEERSHGNAAIAIATQTKLILKGINPDQWNDASPDDPETLTRLKRIAQELGVSL